VDFLENRTLLSGGDIEWMRQFGGVGTSDEVAWAVTSRDDYVYVAGYTTGTLPGQVSAGGQDAFVRKYDAAGNLLWTRQFGTAGGARADGITADATGIYVTGDVVGSLPGQASAGDQDIFVRKYDFDGNELWTRQLGGPDLDDAYNIAAGESGVYVVGTTRDHLPGQTGQGPGNRDAFLLKYDSDGDLLWTRQFGSEDSNWDYGRGVTVDGTGVYVAGCTFGTLPGQVSAGDMDVYVRKYDPDGNVVWTRQFGTSGYDAEDKQCICLDATGVYVTGWVGAALPGRVSSGGADVFVRKYNRDGDVLWTRQFGTTADDAAYDLAADGTGIYLTGYTSGTLPGQVSAGGQDAFVRKYDSDGDLLWTRQFGTTADDSGWGIAAGLSGVYVDGYTDGTLPGQLGGGGQDAFVAKLSSPSENLLTNGDFSLGNTGFTSQLDYIPIGGSHNGPGYYGVVHNPSVDIWSAFGNFGDHTTGTGLMFASDASTTPNTVAWEETVNVSTATDYVFSGWAASMGQYPIGTPVDPSPARLGVFVNGVQVGSPFSVPAQNGQWGQFAVPWNSGTSDVATIKIVDLNTDFVGNDFTLDDLSFTGPTIDTGPTATFSSNGPIHVGETETVQFSDATDSSPIDTAAGFHYAFATDPAALASATYENSSSVPYASFTFSTTGKETIYGRIIAQDNDYHDYSTQFGVSLPGSLLVVNNNDSGPGSLRQAVALVPAGDRVLFDSSLKGQTTTLTTGELVIDKSLDIEGLGATNLTVSGGGASRVFDIVNSSATVTIAGLTISGGRLSTGNGGGILNAGGTLTIADCTISGNSIDNRGGNGGGIYSSGGKLTVVLCTFIGNYANGGGGISNHDGGHATVVSCTLEGNTSYYGGGFDNNRSTMSVVSCTITGNTAYYTGGGIVAGDGAVTTVDSCTIAGNSAQGFEGGGIANAVFTSSTMTITNSTISANSADMGGGITNAAGGTSGTVTVISCTIAGNSALNGPRDRGGGIKNNGAGTVTVASSTISGNTASYGAGIDNDAGATVALTNTIVAGNLVSGTPQDIQGTVRTGSSHNLVGVDSGLSGISNGVSDNIIGTTDKPIDPKLGPLQDNGGPTMTMALLPGSPAIDAGIDVEGVTTDQRGMSRTISGPPDIGSFEFAALTMDPIVVNDGAAQRSNDTTVALTFNQWTNIQTLIDSQTIGSAVQLFGASQIPLEATRYHFNRDTFTLTIDLRLTDSQKTMLDDGRYQLRIDTSQVFALGNPSNPLVDNDGTLDGFVTAKFHQLVGDFNGDGVVSVLDRTDFLAHYGSKLGQSLYDYAYDLNGDKIINLQDYMAWLKLLGRTV